MDKKEYIAEQLKKTYGKKYENYCVTRIINKLDNLNVQFITQQMFRRKEKQIALADLYFPQLNVWVEIDEAQHLKQTWADKKRAEDVIKNNIRTKLKNLEEVIFLELEEPERIIIFDDNKKITIEDINKRIDEIVELINKRIRMLGDNFKPWETAYNTPSYYINAGNIKKKDNVKLGTLQLVSELFNKCYRGNQRAYFTVSKKNKNVMVWCPKLKLDVDDCNKIPYDNEISEDGNYIYETRKENNAKFVNDMLNSSEIRYVFPNFKDEIGKKFYKYFGIYEINKKESLRLNKRVWQKIGDILDLNQFFN